MSATLFMLQHPIDRNGPAEGLSLLTSRIFRVLLTDPAQFFPARRCLLLRLYLLFLLELLLSSLLLRSLLL